MGILTSLYAPTLCTLHSTPSDTDMLAYTAELRRRILPLLLTDPGAYRQHWAITPTLHTYTTPRALPSINAQLLCEVNFQDAAHPITHEWINEPTHQIEHALRMMAMEHYLIPPNRADRPHGSLWMLIDEHPHMSDDERVAHRLTVLIAAHTLMRVDLFRDAIRELALSGNMQYDNPIYMDAVHAHLLHRFPHTSPRLHIAMLQWIEKGRIYSNTRSN